MEVTVEFIDKTVHYKGRVWTIYAVSGNHNGAFAYNGIKPYPTFRYDSHDEFCKRRFNTTYIPDVDIKVIEGEEIDKCLKIEKAAEKKKLNKKYAIEFSSWLTGHSKSFVSKRIEERFNGYRFGPGQIKYEIWKSDGALLLSHNSNNGYTEHSYFDYVTWESEDRLYEKSKRAHEDEIIENNRDYIIEEYKKSQGAQQWN